MKIMNTKGDKAWERDDSTIIRKIGVLFKESKVKKDKEDIQDQEQELEIQRHKVFIKKLIVKP